MSRTMRALSLRDGKLALRTLPMPVPGEGQVLVKTLACAICASDHHYMDHPEVALADRSGMRVSDPSRDVVMGHEFCAAVVEYGPGTEKKWPVGTRVTSPPVLFGRSGMQIVGMTPDAPGGFGEYFLLNEGFARPLPDDLPPERLALVDAMAVGWYYTRVGAEEKNAVPLVIGLGAIGLSAVVALRQRGIGPIVAADYSASRRELARTLGADVLVDPREEPAYAAWRRVAWGSPDEVFDRVKLAGKKRCVIYECVGVEGVLTDIVDSCEIGTRILSAGGAAQDVIHSAAAHIKGINIQFGGGPSIDDWYETMDLVSRGVIDPTPLVGEVVPLEGLADAIERARSSSGPVRIVYRA